MFSSRDSNANRDRDLPITVVTSYITRYRPVMPRAPVGTSGFPTIAARCARRYLRPRAACERPGQLLLEYRRHNRELCIT